MFPRELVHSDLHRITVLFDTDDPKQTVLLHVPRASFGEGHAESEYLDPPRYQCLDLLPGGALEVLR